MLKRDSENDGQTVLERAADEVERVEMPDRDPDENPGLDLTAPVDNVPANQVETDEDHDAES